MWWARLARHWRDMSPDEGAKPFPYTKTARQVWGGTRVTAFVNETVLGQQTRRGLGWPAWKPVQLTRRKVVWGAGPWRTQPSTVGGGRKGSSRELSRGCTCWLRRTLQRRVGGCGSASARSSGSWRDRTQKVGEATANGVKRDQRDSHTDTDERLEGCKREDRRAWGPQALGAPE